MKIRVLILSLVCAGLSGSGAPLSESAPSRVLFLGDSLTAGYGLDPQLAFPSLIQQKIDSAGLGFEVFNAGLSGETSAGGLRRIEWVLRRKVDVLVLELGANDGLRGIPPETTRRNLQGIIDLARNRYPDIRIVLAGMKVPPNLGRFYSERFESVFTDIAEANEVVLIPFLLEGVAGRAELNLPDGIHPTARGHQIIADHIWKTLKPILTSIR